METCVACAAPLRPGARFCTRCGAAVAMVEPVRPAAPAPTPVPVFEPEAEPEPGLPAVEPEPELIPSRIPPRVRYAAPPARSAAATWSLVTGAAPLLVSVVGNLIAAELGVRAVIATENGEAQGAWAPVFVTLALVFVGNAALLTVCAITGGRGIRETANGITRGRGLAVGGLASGGVNLVLWVAGVVISVGSFGAVLA